MRILPSGRNRKSVGWSRPDTSVVRSNSAGSPGASATAAAASACRCGGAAASASCAGTTAVDGLGPTAGLSWRRTQPSIAHRRGDSEGVAGPGTRNGATTAPTRLTAALKNVWGGANSAAAGLSASGGAEGGESTVCVARSETWSTVAAVVKSRTSLSSSPRVGLPAAAVLSAAAAPRTTFGGVA